MQYGSFYCFFFCKLLLRTDKSNSRNRVKQLYCSSSVLKSATSIHSKQNKKDIAKRNIVWINGSRRDFRPFFGFGTSDQIQVQSLSTTKEKTLMQNPFTFQLPHVMAQIILHIISELIEFMSLFSVYACVVWKHTIFISFKRFENTKNL